MSDMNEFNKVSDETKYLALVQYNSMDETDRQIIHNGIRLMTDDQMQEFLTAVCQGVATMRATTQHTLEQSKNDLMSYGYLTALKDNRDKFTDAEYKDAMNASPFVDKEF